MSVPRTRYSVAGELGRGAFGVVYLIQGETGRKLALKLVNLEKKHVSRKKATEEATILHSLTHKHVMYHVNSYIKEPYLCIITEFCEGGDLDSLITRLGFSPGLPERLIVVWLMQTASALDYMHTNDPVILHRDLKPENILVTGKGNLRLGDLGIARKLHGPEDMALTPIGTFHYLSPEVLMRQPYNSKADIWSLGCVFYKITANGKADEVFKMLWENPEAKKKPKLPDRYTQDLRDTILSMLTEDPTQRPSASNILSSQVIEDFKLNPDKPAEIIREYAVSNGITPPTIARNPNLRTASFPLSPEDIVVPDTAIEFLTKMVKMAAELEELKSLAAELRDEFNTLADELDVHLKNVNIARISGGVVGVIGGVVAAVGIIAIPFTAGLSAVVAGIGGSVAAGAGGATAAGAKIAQAVIEGKKTRGVAEKWNSFCNKSQKFIQCYAELGVNEPGLTRFLLMGVGAIGLSEGAKAFAQGAGIAVGRAAGRIGAATVAGGVASVLVVGLSLHDIVDGAIEIHREKKSKAGDIIRGLAKHLDTFSRE